MGSEELLVDWVRRFRIPRVRPSAIRQSAFWITRSKSRGQQCDHEPLYIGVLPSTNPPPPPSLPAAFPPAHPETRAQQCRYQANEPIASTQARADTANK